MVRRRNNAVSESVFILTLPMRCQPWQISKLDKGFQAYNNMKNALIAKELKALKQLERTRVWKNLRAAIADGYRMIEMADSDDRRNDAKKQQKELFEQREKLLKDNGFTKGAFEKAISPMQRHYRNLTNSAIAQKVANNVWQSFEAYLFGARTGIHFSKAEDFLCIEGKSNASGIIYYAEKKVVNVSGVKIPVSLNKKDPYGYETEALKRKIHYCKIIRKPYSTGWRYFLQLVLSGEPPVKVRPETGELLHPMGRGRVGNDIGPQTLATVSDNSASLIVFCEKVQDMQAAIRRINRAMDRSRRATNPQIFYSDGRVVPIDKLPNDCKITIRGTERRHWIESNRYKKLKQKRRAMYCSQADLRKTQHNELANKLLALGDEHYIEQMNWKALAMRAKKTEVSDKTGKYKRKKRFGKSIANKSPATFVAVYEKKVVAAGGSFVRINTAEAKASQYNHETKAYKKKHLHQRWNTMPDGSKIQRDLYSAFLIQNTNSYGNGFEQLLLEAKYPKFKQLHDAEIQRLSTIKMPSSAGVKRTA